MRHKLFIFFRLVYFYVNETAVDDFIEKHNGSVVNGRELTVERANPDTSIPTNILLVKNFCKSIAQDKVSEHFPGSLSVRRPTEKHKETPKS